MKSRRLPLPEIISRGRVGDYFCGLLMTTSTAAIDGQSFSFLTLPQPETGRSEGLCETRGNRARASSKSFEQSRPANQRRQHLWAELANELLRNRNQTTPCVCLRQARNNTDSSQTFCSAGPQKRNLHREHKSGKSLLAADATWNKSTPNSLQSPTSRHEELEFCSRLTSCVNS